MTKPVFVVSEWLPKKECEEELSRRFKELLSLTLKKEKGCKRAHVTHQIQHPGSPGKSKYTLVLLQEYENLNAFDQHCAADYVKSFVSEHIENKVPGKNLVEAWTCRLFSEIK